MAKPKLALIPATQGSKLYSVLPADGVGDFTFSRNSAATRINKDGLIETVAVGKSRLHYPLIDGKVVGCPSHLLEPESTNKFSYSEDFSNTSWSIPNTTVAVGSILSPKGDLTAYKLNDTIADTSHYIVPSASFIETSTTNDKSFSFFAKKGEFNRVGYVDIRFLNGCEVVFNLEILQIERTYGNLHVSSKIEDYGNGWCRCSVVYTGETRTKPAVYVLNENYDNTTKVRDYAYIGNGSGIYIFGFQLEVKSYPTSYIPTQGSAVTRVAETANGAGDASTFNDSEGVLMAEIFNKNGFVTISDGSGGNRIAFGEEGGNRVVITANNGSLQNYITLGVWDETFVKIAIRYSLSNLKIYINGINVDSRNTFNLPLNLNRLAFDSGAGGSNFYGSAKQIQYFDSALNDSDLEKITSWTSFTDLANGQTYSIK